MITNTLFHYLSEVNPFRMPWEFVRSADVGPTPQLLNQNSKGGPRIHVLPNLPGDSDAHWSLRTIKLANTSPKYERGHIKIIFFSYVLKLIFDSVLMVFGLMVFGGDGVVPPATFFTRTDCHFVSYRDAYVVKDYFTSLHMLTAIAKFEMFPSS